MKPSEMTNERLLLLLKKLLVEIEECREIEYVLENIEMTKKEYEEIINYELPKTEQDIFLETVYKIEEIHSKSVDNKLIFYKTYATIKQMIIIDFYKKSINIFNATGDIPHDLKVDLEILKPLNYTITYNNFIKEEMK